MYKVILAVLTILVPISVLATDDSKTNNATINQLIKSFEIAKEPGLYEIRSKETGNLVYVYVDRSGNVEMEVLKPKK